ncbi:Wzz/FepE/Etk N-terminal domain-containing protein [Gammaproteobacteria bacterium AS21]
MSNSDITDKQHSCSVCQNRASDDEIDLFELVLSIWAGKWIIVAFVVVFVVAGFGYSKLATPVYSVSSHMHINFFPENTQSICTAETTTKDCFNSTASKEYSIYFPAWSIDNNVISKNVPGSSEIDQYNIQLASANQTLTKQLLDNAKQELQAIDELATEIKSSEHIAISTLNAKKTIIAIEQNKQQALSLSPVSITKKSPKTNLILVFSLLLGGMLGCFVILVRQAIRNYKDKQKT